MLQGVDVTVESGQAVGVTGPLDSGWRSLLRLIVGLDPLSAGQPSSSRALRETRPRLLRATAPSCARRSCSPRRSIRSWRPRPGRAVAGIGAADGVPAAGRAWGALGRDPLGGGRAVAEGGVDPVRPAPPRARARLRARPAHVLLEVEPPLASAGDRRTLADFVRRILAAGRGMLIGTPRRAAARGRREPRPHLRRRSDAGGRDARIRAHGGMAKVRRGGKP